MIEARNLSKHFGAVKAVQNVSFVASDGQITGLLGPNGAGKSTCLRLVYGVLEADAGVSLIDGIDVAGETSVARAGLGVLPHAAGLYANLTARENIAYFGALQGLDAARIATRIDQLARSLDMSVFIDRRAKGFSQGQRVKTALARALIHAPRNLVLDEPTNGLDVMAIRNLRGLLLALKNAGHCILFSSHVMQEIAALCDRVVIIGDGRLLADDTPFNIRERLQVESFEEAFLRVLGTTEGVI
jgi:sodium transport system ATP-binding protein